MIGMVPTQRQADEDLPEAGALYRFIGRFRGFLRW